MSVTTEVYRRVYDDADGTYLTVGPDSDGLGFVTVFASAVADRTKYFGDGILSIPNNDMARAVAMAIIECAQECDALRIGEQ